MDSVIVRYTRTITHIHGLQQERKIVYAVTQTEQGYGVCVTETGCVFCKEEIDFVCTSLVQAEHFLLFLYENNVAAAHVLAVYSDVKSSGFFKNEQEGEQVCRKEDTDY